jgi:hypothetical protein
MIMTMIVKIGASMIVHNVVRTVSPPLRILGSWEPVLRRIGIETIPLIKPKTKDVIPIQINPLVAL